METFRKINYPPLNENRAVRPPFPFNRVSTCASKAIFDNETVFQFGKFHAYHFSSLS